MSSDSAPDALFPDDEGADEGIVDMFVLLFSLAVNADLCFFFQECYTNKRIDDKQPWPDEDSISSTI